MRQKGEPSPKTPLGMLGVGGEPRVYLLFWCKKKKGGFLAKPAVRLGRG